MHNVTEGKQYLYGNSGKTWGTVKSLSVKAGICVVSLPGGCEREFGLYEVSAWIKSYVLIEDNDPPAMVDTGDGAPQYTIAPTGQLSLL